MEQASTTGDVRELEYEGSGFRSRDSPEERQTNITHMHYCNWRAGASQPSRANGPIFLYIYICDSHCTYRNVIRASNFADALHSEVSHCPLSGSSSSTATHYSAVPQQRIHRHCLQQNSQEVVSRFRPGLTCLSRLCARIPARHAVRTSQGREPPSLVPRPFERGRQARAVETPGASSLLMIN